MVPLTMWTLRETQQEIEPAPDRRECPRLFFSPPEELQEAIGQKAKRQMMVQSAPRAPFKMIQPQFLFELLVALLNHPPLMRPLQHLPHGGVKGRIT